MAFGCSFQRGQKNRFHLTKLQGSRFFTDGKNFSAWKHIEPEAFSVSAVAHHATDPIGSMYGIYLPRFTTTINHMYVDIPCMDPKGIYFFHISSYFLFWEEQIVQRISMSPENLT